MFIASRSVRALTTVGVAGAIAVSGLSAPVDAEAAARLSCKASVSDKQPTKYSYVDVRVRTKAKAKVRTTAHYKTTTTTHAARANSKGRAVVDYYISGATSGYKVRIDVTVKSKKKTATCSTSFTPR